MSEKKKDHNRLIREKSPYLLQHAYNPIDWYPWSEEAFRKAKEEDKPVFLSIGYSACHWCHVMERESFDDEEVAQVMNEHFVAIKADREERPDVDGLYMAVCQSMTGSGGWPLTIFMTPDKKPFLAGTYFPKHSWHGNPGLLQLLKLIAQTWKMDKEGLLEAGDRIKRNLQEYSAFRHGGVLKEEHLEQAFQTFQSSFDETYGGFGIAPKFPTPHQLSFLLRWWKRSGNTKALEIVTKTLDGMCRGGIYDHLGFGFHRYSTDRTWLVPHFEKMLYDQALLAIAYLEAYQATKNERYALIAREIFNYVLRDMTSPEGAFFSSEDADSEGIEGKFYVWSLDEIKEILSHDGTEDKDAAKLFSEFYGVGENGNFELGMNILNVMKPIEDFAREKEVSLERCKEILERSRQRLFAHRITRVRPFKDDKILTDWNGLMIAALAKGAQVLDEPSYAHAAWRAADFLLDKLRDRNGRLLHRFRDGEAKIPGYLDDFAFLTWGLIELYEATFDARPLKEALSLTDDMLKLFRDEKNDGFFMSGSDAEAMLVRMKELYDGATPSGNSIAALNLLRLSRMTGRKDLMDAAARVMKSFGDTIAEKPSSYTQFLIALDFLFGPTKEIVIAGNIEDEATLKLIREIRNRFLPNKVLLLHPDNEERKALEKIVPFIAQQNTIDGKATAYICEDFNCKAPTTDLNEMLSLLNQ